MENIFINQTEIYDSLVKFLTNFKKDGADRKTMDYCKRKLEILETYWRDYQRNHRKCCELAEFDHVYFTKNCFDTAEEVYLATKELINKTIEQLLARKQGVSQPPSEAGASNQAGGLPRSQAIQPQKDDKNISGQVSKLEEMIRKQTIHFRAFMRTIATIEVEQLKNKWEFEDALKSLQNRWAIIDSVHWEIEGESGDQDMWYQEEFTRHEKIYNNLKKTISSKMWSESHRDKSTPKMDIPIFQGNYHHWTTFKDLFTEAIHKNPSLSNAQKMQFLKSKVTGEAERLIHHLQISSENYEVCWEILNHRYGNQRLIFMSHVNILMSLPTMPHQSTAMIKKLHDVTKECLHAIQNLGVDITTWDPLLIYLLSQKLDSESYTEYMESIKKPRELPILKEFLNFLENKFTALEAPRPKQESNNQKNNQPFHQNQSSQKKSSYFRNNQQPSNNNQYYNMKNNVKTLHASRSITCALCNSNHGLWMCAQFLQLSDEQKLKTVHQLNCCVNCLYNHFNKQCFSNKRCRKCNASHNTLLHEGIILRNKSSTSTKSNHKAATTPTVCGAMNKEHASTSTHVSWDDVTETLLSTALVKVTGADGIQHTMRALIDQGSQISIINENAAQILKLKRNQCKGTIFGIGEKENKCKGVMTLHIQSIYSDFALEGEVLIMNNLIKSLPNKTFAKQPWPHIQNINLADPEFNISRSVDLLLGADVYCKIMLGGILRGDSDDQPIAQQTHLGWLLCGTMKPHYRCNVVLNNTDDLRRFWEHEDINQQNEMSTEDQECLRYFLSTTERLEDGRFQVRLPFKPESKNQLGSTKPIALAQFCNMEKKLHKDPEMQKEYEKFMNEYVELNHMIPSITNTTPECYLPHHCVTRAESTTTKLRVVFNASARSLSGLSLNDVMYRGPNLQQDLQELILKWRQYQFVYTADIEKMYRQIMVHPKDQSYQKILWRFSQQAPIQSFQLTTVTYGTKPAPFLAMMCLKQLATTEMQKYPDAAKALADSFYMDDFCGGAHSIQQANQLKLDLIKLLREGGFNLRKWASNERHLLADLEVDLCNQQTYEFKQSDSTKTLGLAWNPQKDKFIFDSKLEPELQSTPTKRSLLSDISKLFDPLGWLTPFSITMKILFQSVWLSNLDWDDALPEDIKIKWINLRKDMKEINTIEVKRWLGIDQYHTIQLHGFCDASNKAYAAVIYCCVRKGDVSMVSLIAAKNRLVPISKIISSPRLELMGAELLSKLTQKVRSCLDGYDIQTYCWTDSTAVLGWIQGDPARWKPFVSNRVQAITKIIPSTNWKYVNTNENPADCASRGLTIKQLREHELWWNGPAWLPSFQNQDELQSTYQTNLEVKKSVMKQSNTVIVDQQDKSSITNIINHLLNKFCSFTKLIRIFAWILRLPTAGKVRPPYLALHELRRAKMLIIKNVQTEEFNNDIIYLHNKGKVQSKSKILNLNPILDQDGILRVGGRLRNAQINPEMKHPIILPNNHRLTTLIIRHAHELTFHGGARLTLSNIRQKYWIISGYTATKKFIRHCVTCKKQEPIRQSQLMGDLPSSRVNPESAFYHCGVDYTGFVEVKANKGRGIKTTKGYIALFVCMATKAVHLELVSDLTSSAFLAAVNRMAARRGAPRHIYSDNGTNFIGANRILQEEYERLQQVFSDSFHKEITEMQIEWHFNAPSWPHAGGLWERAVRSLKHHLKRVIGHQKLTFEEYTTLLSKLEACLNSRPLCAISEDPEDLDFLTPAHFLSTRPGLAVIETAEDARTRWHFVSKLFEDLWKRWKTEYLTQLSSRSKWVNYQKNVEVGDLVVIQDDNLPAGKWPVGRVVEVHPGKDDLVRVVTLKTKNGYMKRPIVKLSVLPIEKTKEHQRSCEPVKQETKKDETPTQNSRHNNSTTHPRIVNIALALILFICISIPTTTASFSFKQLDSNQTLYFDPLGKIQLIRDKWKLVTYYNMSPYWQGDKAVKDFTNYLEKTCQTIKEPSHCNMILLQIRHDYNELEYYNQLLLSQHYSTHLRTRRGLINAVGSIANSLFGVLDESFAEKYKQDIELVHRNQKHLAQLWKNQTSIVEAEHNILQRTEDMIEKQHKIINKHINALDIASNKLQKEINVMSIQQDFTFVSIATINLMQNLKRIQETLIDTISEIYHGQISLHILTPAQLKRELQIIYGQMPKELALPIDNIETDLQYIYKLLKIKARVTQNYIIFEITFPLISRENFQLYKILPVPQQINNSMISVIPVSDYVAVNLRKDAYFVPTVHELDTCLYHGESFMCELFKPILSLENDENFCDKNLLSHKCKVEKSTCKNRWVELHSTSQYLYFCCGIYSIKVICEDHVTVHQLTRAGVISMSQKCIVKGKDFALYSLQQQSNQIDFSPNIFIPELDQINHIVHIKIPTAEELPEDVGLNRSLSILGDQIKDLKSSKAEVDDLSSHDIHHYAICYILLAIAICAAVAWTWRKYCQRPARGREEDCHRQESVETVPKSTRDLYSEIQPRKQTNTADRQQSESEHIGLSAFLTKRWPSSLRKTEQRDRAKLPDPRNKRVFTIEDSLV